MKLIRYLFILPSYLKGVLRFRSGAYPEAKILFEKSLKINGENDNENLFQYYGQTLLVLSEIEKSFKYLKMAYMIYEKHGWEVVNDEEYKLAKDTLNGLKFLKENHDLVIDDFVSDPIISIKK